MEQQVRLKGGTTGERADYEIKEWLEYSWLRVKLYEVRIPGLVHGDKYIVGVGMRGELVDVYEPFTFHEPDFGQISDAKALTDSTAVSEFIDLLENVYASNSVLFKVVRSASDLPDSLRMKAIPFSMKPQQGGWELSFAVYVEGFGTENSSLLRTVVRIENEKNTIAVTSNPL